MPVGESPARLFVGLVEEARATGGTSNGSSSNSPPSTESRDSPLFLYFIDLVGVVSTVFVSLSDTFGSPNLTPTRGVTTSRLTPHHFPSAKRAEVGCGGGLPQV